MYIHTDVELQLYGLKTTYKSWDILGHPQQGGAPPVISCLDDHPNSWAYPIG